MVDGGYFGEGMKKFQKTYSLFNDIEEIRGNLIRTGYNPIPIPSSRNPDIQTDHFTFEFLPNLKVNVYSKEKSRDVQVSWNSVEELEEHERELIDILGGKSIGYIAGYWGNIDKFIEEVEVAYLKYIRPYRSKKYFRKLEKVKKLFSDKRL